MARAPKQIKIAFTADALYRTLDPVQYRKGQVIELREDLAARWVARGVATDDADEVARAELAAEPKQTSF